MSYAVRNRPLTKAAVLAEQITANGYAVIDDYVASNDLKTAQAFVSDAIADNGEQYVGFTGTDHLGGTFLKGLPTDPSFVDLCRSIHAAGTEQAAPHIGFYQI